MNYKMNNTNTQATFGISDFEDNLKALHKICGRVSLISFISSIAKNHDPIALKGKGNTDNRTQAAGLSSSYYKSLLSIAVGDFGHASKLFYTDGGHGYNIIFNKYVYEDVMNHTYAKRKTLGI